MTFDWRCYEIREADPSEKGFGLKNEKKVNAQQDIYSLILINELSQLALLHS
jgi:hypothetical protein